MQINKDSKTIRTTWDDASADLFEIMEGAFCETTKRVVIISPYPAAIRSLVTALSIRCYDVMMFHNENDPMLIAIQADLTIIDRTMVPSAGTANERISKAVPRLVLVSEPISAAISDEEQILSWPCPLPEVLKVIEHLASSESNGLLASMESIGQLMKYRDLVVDLKRVTVHKNGQRVDVTRTEFDILRVLLANGGGVLTRQEMIQHIWGETYFGGSNSIDVHIKSLRRKLGDDPKQPRYIETVRGIGYRIAD